VVPTPRDRDIERLSHLASRGALAYSVAGPLLDAGLIATSPQLSSHALAAVVATAAYLPPYVHTVRRGLQGARPPALPMLVMAAVVIGVTPVVGAVWLRTWGAVGAVVLIARRPGWSIPAFLVLLGAGTAWSIELGSPAEPEFVAVTVWYATAVASRALIMFVLVWLVAALRRLRIARVVLADEALAAERRRLDEELRRTVGEDLAVVVERGTRAGRLVGTDTASAAAELRELVDGSRRTLAAARRMIARYKVVSPRARLDTAAALLRTAGIEAHVEIADGDLPDVFDETFDSSLRSLTAELLRGHPTGPVLIRMIDDGGAARLEWRAVDLARPPVVAA
jgi:two-component system, NarL family, sensor histidine kinase DesK